MIDRVDLDLRGRGTDRLVVHSLVAARRVHLERCSLAQLLALLLEVERDGKPEHSRKQKSGSTRVTVLSCNTDGSTKRRNNIPTAVKGKCDLIVATYSRILKNHEVEMVGNIKRERFAIPRTNAMVSKNATRRRIGLAYKKSSVAKLDRTKAHISRREGLAKELTWNARRRGFEQKE